jgi:hypothetical protein
MPKYEKQKIVISTKEAVDIVIDTRLKLAHFEYIDPATGQLKTTRNIRIKFILAKFTNGQRKAIDDFLREIMAVGFGNGCKLSDIPANPFDSEDPDPIVPDPDPIP